jgi:hypothetical protein
MRAIRRGAGKFTMMSYAPMLVPLSTLRNLCRAQNIESAELLAENAHRASGTILAETKEA